MNQAAARRSDRLRPRIHVDRERRDRMQHFLQDFIEGDAFALPSCDYQSRQGLRGTVMASVAIVPSAAAVRRIRVLWSAISAFVIANISTFRPKRRKHQRIPRT